MSSREFASDATVEPNSKRESGFSMIELVIVVTVILIITSFAAPRVITMIHASRLRGSAADLESIIQTDRLRAVQDDKFYSLYVSSGSVGSTVFVDLNGSGTYSAAAGDPLIAFSSEVKAIAKGSAPNTADLYGKFLPPGATVTALDGGPGSSDPPVTFSSRGLPCKKQTATGGSVCDSAGGAIPYWIFLQDSVTNDYMAITISPAGRIRKWFYSKTVWSGM
jgi:prepilin-type N-terminal cleavage/methylation domain-containing protein